MAALLKQGRESVEAEEDLRAKLNGETARLTWSELQRHFASGAVIKVESGSDLVDMAVAVARDDTALVSTALEAGTVARASADDARRWERGDRSLLAVVVAPWVLVQEVEEH